MSATDQAAKVIETCRDINRHAAAQCVAKGVEPVDATIAAIYSAHDLASAIHAGDSHAAIEYMRTALDLMERQLLELDRARH